MDHRVLQVVVINIWLKNKIYSFATLKIVNKIIIIFSNYSFSASNRMKLTYLPGSLEIKILCLP